MPQNFAQHVPTPQSSPNAQPDPNPQCFSNFDPTTESKEKVTSKDYNETLDQSAQIEQALKENVENCDYFYLKHMFHLSLNN